VPVNPHNLQQSSLMQEPEQQATESTQTETPHSDQKKHWWRSTIAGYVFVFPIVALGVGLNLLRAYFLPRLYFPSAFLLIAILCISLGWGFGPGLLAVLLSCAALVYFYLIPFLHLNSLDFDAGLFFQMLPFAIESLAVVFIIRQLKKTRQRELEITRTARDQAEHLADVNEQLKEANQLKDFFLSVASHELKTPITTIRGEAQLALRRLNKLGASLPEAAAFRGVLTRVDEQTIRLTNLVNDLLHLSSLRSQKLELDIQPCNLNEICTRAVEEQCLLSKRPINLMLPSPAIQLQADPARLGQVMTNLTNNALKYSPVESEVSVEVRREQDVAHIEVRDAGQGIPPEQMASIFQPFFRTEEARASTVSGTGLGLAICKEIIDQHQGRIWCESTVGQGSTFFVELPLAS
jgi:signal transduction histidine kinase